MTKSVQPDAKNPLRAAEGRPSEVPMNVASSRHDGEAEDEGRVGLEKIREILFGAIHRELERKLVRADAQLVARAHELEHEHRRRTEVLEAHLKKEMEALGSRLERVSIDTAESLRKMSREHHDGLISLEQRLTKIEEASTAGQRELRQQLLEQAKSFLDELQHLRKDILATLEQELRLSEGELVQEPHGAEGHPRH